MTIKLPDFFRVKLLVVGDVMLDRYWFGKVNRISPEAPVPVVAVNRSEERAGGAANVAANVVAMGARCELLSVVGDDEGGGTLGRLLDQLGVDNHLHIDDKMKTTVKVRIVSQNQQLLRSDFESLPGHDVLARCFDDFANELPNVECVILSDYGKGGLPRIQEMIDLGVSVGVPVMVDPKGVDFSRYKRATMVTPNLAEFEAVVGKCADEQQMEERAVALIRDLELSGLLVTMGSQGARLFSPEGEMVKCESLAREVYDVSGAGDTVIAIFSTALAAGMGRQEAMEIANIAAGIVVGKVGTAQVEREEIEAVLQLSEQ